ncbi:hypothetical protein PENTCL1PPCAC_9187, partial [Pristionchus entomophagus]
TRARGEMRYSCPSRCRLLLLAEDRYSDIHSDYSHLFLHNREVLCRGLYFISERTYVLTEKSDRHWNYSLQ